MYMLIICQILISVVKAKLLDIAITFIRQTTMTIYQNIFSTELTMSLVKIANVSEGSGQLKICVQFSGQFAESFEIFLNASASPGDTYVGENLKCKCHCFVVILVFPQPRVVLITPYPLQSWSAANTVEMEVHAST